MMAVTEIRNRGSQGRDYYERKRLEGKTGKEALRCLKRRLSGLACYQLIADRRGTIRTCGSPMTGRPTPPTCTSPTSRHQPARPRPAQTPPGLNAFIALDWRGGQLTGIEILDASAILPADLLDQAEIIS